jgi:hypothetical protein
MEIIYNKIKVDSFLYDNISINDFYNMNLAEIAKQNDFKKFEKFINNQNVINISIKFFQNIFIKIDFENIYYLLLSYFIFYCQDNIFLPFKTVTDLKLCDSAFDVITCLNNLQITQYTLKNFVDIFDNYISLCKLWLCNKSFKKIDEIHLYIQKLSYIDNDIEYNNKIIDEKINKMLYENQEYSIKLLLENYLLYFSNNKTYLWKKIKTYSMTDHENIFLILIACLRIKLISLFDILNDKKDLYYEIDIDSIFYKISYDQLYPHDIIKIIKIFSNKIKKYNDKFICIDIISDSLTNDFIISVINIFEQFYNSIYFTPLRI